VHRAGCDCPCARAPTHRHSLDDSGIHIEDDVDYTGADIDSLYGIETHLQCKSACEEHPRCFAFTFVKAESACWLKGEGYATRSNPRTISGSINASLASVRRAAIDSGELPPDPLGFDEGDTFDSSDDEVPTYDDERREGYREEEGAEEDEAAFLGPDAADLGPPLEVDDVDVARYNDSTSFFGDVRLVYDCHAISECEAACVEDGRCVAWTLDKYRFVCLLRLRNASSLRFADDVIGGRLSDELIQQRADRMRVQQQQHLREGGAGADAANAANVANAANATEGGRADGDEIDPMLHDEPSQNADLRFYSGPGAPQRAARRSVSGGVRGPGPPLAAWTDHDRHRRASQGGACQSWPMVRRSTTRT
jgi:hypothetical protein